MQSILQMYLCHSAVNVKEKQVEVWIKLFESFFNSLCYNVVCNATEWLNTDNFGNSAPSETRRLTRNQPTLAKLIGRVDTLFCIICLFKNGMLFFIKTDFFIFSNLEIRFSKKFCRNGIIICVVLLIRFIPLRVLPKDR